MDTSTKFCDQPGCGRKLSRVNSVGCCRHHPKEYRRRFAAQGTLGRWSWGEGRTEEEQRQISNEQARIDYAAMEPEQKSEKLAKKREYRAALPLSKKRHYQYFKKFGVSYEQIVELFESQGHRCAMPGCARPIQSIHRSDKSQAPDGVVDHCHETGKVRGILCHKCNVNLGHYERASRNGAAEYLAREPPIK